MPTKSAKSVAKKSARKTPRSAKPREVNSCLCGCGGKTFSRFCPGHDARLVGMIKRGELKRLTVDQATFAKAHGVKLGESAKEKKPATKGK